MFNNKCNMSMFTYVCTHALCTFIFNYIRTTNNEIILINNVNAMMIYEVGNFTINVRIITILP